MTPQKTKGTRDRPLRAGVEDSGEDLVGQEGQRLTLRLEAWEDLNSVHARLDELRRDPAPERLVLLGHGPSPRPQVK